MDNRCNHFDDCQDKSDEYMCRYIQLDKSRYRNRDIPFPSWHEKLKVEIGFDLQDIVDVNEPHVSLHTQIITACLKYFKIVWFSLDVILCKVQCVD